MFAGAALFQTLLATSWILACISSDSSPGNHYVEDGMQFQIVQVNAGRRVNSFTSYKDVVLTEYIIPPETQGAVFGFSSISSPKSCSSDKTISVYIQHGGYPLFIDGNGTWSGEVFANRSDFAYLEYPATETNWKISLPSPRSGRWYSAVYIKQPTSHIKQNGLFTVCEITYFSSFLVSAYPNPVIDLESGQRFNFHDLAVAASRRVFKMCLKDDRVDFVDVILECSVGCPALVEARSDGLPLTVKRLQLGGLHQKSCSFGPCTLTYVPVQNKCQYVRVSFDNSTVHATFTLSMSAIKCRRPTKTMPVSTRSFLPAGFPVGSPGGSSLQNESYYQVGREQQQNPGTQPQCPYVLRLTRLDTGPAFSTAFGVSHYSWPTPEFLFVPRDVFSDTVLLFDILPLKDTGGTLFASLNVTGASETDLRNLTIIACLSLGMSSRFDIENTCQGPTLKVNSTQLYSRIFLPYPEIGTWHFNIQGQPLSSPQSDGEEPFSLVYIPVKFVVKTMQCGSTDSEGKNSCGPYGTCRVTLNSGVLISTSCSCQAGWKGWDCSNGDSADSMSSLLVAVFFLTISNLFFIPAAVVAVKRKYYTEALVYFATCFFSSFYHACDQPLKRLALCIMDFGVLQFCDFYVSILSFWVTIIAMADLPFNLKSLAHMVGCIGIALGVEYEKTGIWVFAVPALTAMIVLAISWGFRSYRLKQFVPRKRYWLIHFLPGFSFAALGLILFAFVETKSNYKCVHSVWHIVMALAVIFFLPTADHRHDGKYPNSRNIGTESNLSTSTSLSQELAKDSASDSSADAAIA